MFKGEETPRLCEKTFAPSIGGSGKPCQLSFAEKAVDIDPLKTQSLKQYQNVQFNVPVTIGLQA